MVDRRPVDVRGLALRLGTRAIEELGRRIDGDATLSSIDLNRLADICLRYGMGTKVEVTIANPEVLAIVGDVASRHMEPEQFRAFRTELEERLADR